jgi:hypothetical protein
MNIYVEVEWIFMLNMNEYLCWSWMNIYVEVEWIFMLNMNEYFCWIWMNIYVEYEWIFMLKLNEYFCWSWMNIFVEVEWIFLLKLNEYLCWIWMNIYVEVEWIFLLKLNEYLCWIWIFFLNMNTFVEVEWIFFLNMNANSWSWTNIFCWILKQIANHSYTQWIYILHDNQFRHKLTVVTLITSFQLISRQYTSNFVTSRRIYLAWSEWNVHWGHLFWFGGFMQGGWVIGWNQTNRYYLM